MNRTNNLHTYKPKTRYIVIEGKKYPLGDDGRARDYLIRYLTTKQNCKIFYQKVKKGHYRTGVEIYDLGKLATENHALALLGERIIEEN